MIAYSYRLRLQDMYECRDYETACSFLEELALDMANSKVRELWNIAKSLTRNAEEILNYFVSRKTNAILEGFNSKISLIKNRARGFRNMDNFKNMIYFCMGGFDFPFIPIQEYDLFLHGWIRFPFHPYYGVSAIYPPEIANNRYAEDNGNGAKTEFDPLPEENVITFDQASQNSISSRGYIEISEEDLAYEMYVFPTTSFDGNMYYGTATCYNFAIENGAELGFARGAGTQELADS